MYRCQVVVEGMECYLGVSGSGIGVVGIATVIVLGTSCLFIQGCC